MTYSMLKGLQCIIGRFQTQAAICKFSDVREAFTAQQKDRLLSFLMLNAIEAKALERFPYNPIHLLCMQNY